MTAANWVEALVALACLNLYMWVRFGIRSTQLKLQEKHVKECWKNCDDMRNLNIRHHALNEEIAARNTENAKIVIAQMANMQKACEAMAEVSKMLVRQGHRVGAVPGLKR